MANNGYAKIEIIDLQPKNGLYLRDIVIEGSAAPNDSVDCEIHYTGNSFCQMPVLAFAGASAAFGEMDYGVIRYRWDSNTNSGGTDLDTRTSILLPSVSGYSVGYSHGGNGYSSNGQTAVLGPTGQELIVWGGDNQSPYGEEAILINFKAIKNAFPGLSDIPIQLGAVWYGSSGTNGNIDIQFSSYLGGNMQPFLISGQNIAYDWTPVSGARTVQVIDLPYCVYDAGHSSQIYDDCGVFHYAPQSQQGYFDFGSGYLGNGTDSLNRSLTTGTTDITPTTISYFENDGLIVSNSDWTQSPDSQSILTTTYAPFVSGTSAVYSQAAYGVKRVFKFGPEQPSNLPQKLSVNICPIYSLTGTPVYEETGIGYYGEAYPSGDFSGIVSIASYENAWMQYDISSGVDTVDKSFVAFSVSLLDEISSSNYLPINSGKFSPSLILQFGPSGVANICNTFTLNEVAGHCNSGDYVIDSCITGEYLTTDEIDAEVKKAMNLITGGTATDDSGSLSGTTMASQYSYYTGAIVYNAPSSGDAIVFNSYDTQENYSGDFRNTFGYNPLYPEVSKIWQWGIDYNSIDTLVDKINSDLNDTNYNFWVPSPCNTRDKTPIYKYGPLLEATKAGSNLILLTAKQAGGVGNYYLQSSSSQPPVSSGIAIQKYLTPSFVSLEGRNSLTDGWTTVEVHSGIDWSRAAHIPTSGFYNRFDVTDPRSINDKKKDDEDQQQSGASGNFKIDILGEVTVTGLNNCGKTSAVDITFYRAPFSGSCTPPDGDDDKNPDKNPANDPYNDFNGNLGNPYVFGNILKTGWKFNNSSSYNYYRVNFSGFSGQAPVEQGIPRLEFYATNIDFYNIDANRDVFYGATCLEGYNYNAEIEGIASGRMTGTATAQIAESGSGIYYWTDFEIVGEPVPNSAKFNFRSAVSYDQFTGYLNAKQIGSGMMFQDVQGYFYDDPVNDVISFSKTLSGLVVGCGQISGGPYNIINGDAWSGATKTLTQYVVKTVDVLVSGYAFNIPYYSNEIDGFGYLQGTLYGYVGGSGNNQSFSIDSNSITIDSTLYTIDTTQGTSLLSNPIPNTSGTYNFNQIIQGIPDIVYQNTVDYYENAQAYLEFDSPGEGSQISLNGTSLMYSLQSGRQAPTYFSASSGLANIINNNPALFQMQASDQNGSLALYSLVSGTEGNNINISCSTGFSFTPFVNGLTHYLPMVANNVFQGSVNQTVAAVQDFAGVPASGNVSGYLNTTSQIRRFEDIWSLETGKRYNMVDFTESGWNDAANFRRPNTESPVIFNSPNSFNVNVSYLPTTKQGLPDVVTLRLSGVNFPGYIEYNITGSN